MRKIIKAYGGSLVITIDAEEQKIYDLKEGDILDLEIKKCIFCKGKGVLEGKKCLFCKGTGIEKVPEPVKKVINPKQGEY